jgi:anti-sigma28 factor (negative regulator of flagellin synthesis)
MKVPGSDGNDGALRRIQEGRSGDSSVQRRSGAEQSTAAGDSPGLLGQLADPQVDTVKFSSLGAMLQKELDPTKVAEERKAKIAALKEQIQNGTYAPPVEGVASAVTQEISLEIMLGGKSLQDGGER